MNICVDILLLDKSGEADFIRNTQRAFTTLQKWLNHSALA